MRTLNDILNKNAAFKVLNTQQREALATCCSIATFKANENIFQMGDPAHECFFIASGTVNLWLQSESKGTVAIETLGENDVLGWSWLYVPYLWNFSADALEPVEAYRLDARCIRTKFETDAKLGYKLMSCFGQIMLERLMATRMQLLDNVGKTTGWVK